MLAGSSYGGTITLDYALAFPKRLSGLILHDTWAWGTRMMMTVLTKCLTSPKVSVDPQRQLRFWCGLLNDKEDLIDGISEIGTLFTAHALPEKKKEVESPDETPIHLNTHNVAFSQNLPGFDVRSRLQTISVPTLVVVGRFDMITPVEFSEEIKARIPNSELIIFENSGHMPGVEEPDAFQEHVYRFFSSRILA